MKRLILLSVLILGACASREGDELGRPEVVTARRTTDAGYQGGYTYGGDLRLETNSVLETQRTMFTVTAAELWRAAPRAYEAVGVGLAAYDSTQMTLGNPGMMAQRNIKNVPISRYLDCGNRGIGRPTADQYNVRLNVMSRVRATSSGSALETIVTGQASQPGVAGVGVECTSTGQLEAAIARSAQLQLALPQTP